jgi:hypothetical protein
MTTVGLPTVLSTTSAENTCTGPVAEFDFRWNERKIDDGGRAAHAVRKVRGQATAVQGAIGHAAAEARARNAILTVAAGGCRQGGDLATTEHTINDALAGLLRETRRAWQSPKVVSSENTGMLKGSNRRPDILVVEPDVSPVTIETEVLPASTVELEALSRLGEQVRTTGRTILSSIAVRLPPRLRDRQGAALQNELVTASDIEAALYTGKSGKSPAEFSRWPRSGWLPGSVADLSILVQSASVPPEVIEEAGN